MNRIKLGNVCNAIRKCFILRRSLRRPMALRDDMLLGGEKVND